MILRLAAGTPGDQIQALHNSARSIEIADAVDAAAPVNVERADANRMFGKIHIFWRTVERHGFGEIRRIPVESPGKDGQTDKREQQSLS